MLLGTSRESLFGNKLAGNGIVKAGFGNKKQKWIVKAGSGNKNREGIVTAGYGNEMDF